MLCEDWTLEIDAKFMETAFDVFYFSIRGKCEERCPFCGAMCTANYRKTLEHSVGMHWIPAFSGWQNPLMREPAIMFCTDPQRVGRSWRLRSGIAGFVSGMDTDKTFAEFLDALPEGKKWSIPMALTDADDSSDMVKGVKAAYRQLASRLAVKFNFINSVPATWPYPRGVPPRGLRLTPHEARAPRILALDGGGLKGFMTLMLLAELERRSGLRVHEMFDLIVGTSIGGILADALGILKWDVARCRDLILEQPRS